MDKMTFRQVRLMKEISQQQLADAIGVHVNTVIKWEKKPDNMLVSKAMAIANFLGCDITNIIFASNPT